MISVTLPRLRSTLGVGGGEGTATRKPKEKLLIWKTRCMKMYVS